MTNNINPNNMNIEQLTALHIKNAEAAADQIGHNNQIPKETRVQIATKLGLKHISTRPDLIRASLYTFGTIILIYGLATNAELKKTLTSMPETTRQLTEELAKKTSQATSQLISKAHDLIPSSEIADKINPALELAKNTAKNLEPAFETGKQIVTKLLNKASESAVKYAPESFFSVAETAKGASNAVIGAAQAALNVGNSAIDMSRNFGASAKEITQAGIQSATAALVLAKENTILIGASSLGVAMASQKTPEILASTVNDIAEITAPIIPFTAKALAKGTFNTVRLASKAAIKTTAITAKIATKVTLTASKITLNTLKTTAEITASSIKIGAKASVFCLKKLARLAYKTENALDVVKEAAYGPKNVDLPPRNKELQDELIEANNDEDLR